MKRIASLVFMVLAAFTLIYSQQDFNTKLSRTYSKKKLVDNIIRDLNKNPSIDELDDDYQIFLRSQYKDELEKFRIVSYALEYLRKESNALSAEIYKENIKDNSPRVANSANIEMFSDGISKGSFRLLKIRVGEPSLFSLKRISIPIYIYLSARGNGLASDKKGANNKISYSDLLDPLGGTINFSVADKFTFIESKMGITHVSLSYQACLKLFNGEDLQTDKSDAFLNGFYSAGILVDTGAWSEKSVSTDDRNIRDNDNISDNENIGVFWLHIRHIGSFLSKDMITKLFNQNLNSTIFGISIESGLFITNTISFKVGFYKYFTKPKEPAFSYLNDWKIKLSLDYTNN